MKKRGAWIDGFIDGSPPPTHPFLPSIADPLTPSLPHDHQIQMECLMGLGQYEEALSLSNGLLRQQSPAQEGALLFWRAQCLYKMGMYVTSIVS